MPRILFHRVRLNNPNQSNIYQTVSNHAKDIIPLGEVKVR
jgi:hypothetical protein